MLLTHQQNVLTHYLMMVQLEPKHVGECMISNNRYLHVPDKCIVLWLMNIELQI